MKGAAKFDPSFGLKGVVHFPLSYLAALAGFLISMPIDWIALLGNEQGWFFRLTGILTGEPLWVPEIAAGLLIGWLAYKRLPSIFAFISWILPGGILLLNLISWQQTMSQYDSTWSTFFGTDCGGSECLYELFVTVPFYTAVGYSIGAVIAHIRADGQTELPMS